MKRRIGCVIALLGVLGMCMGMFGCSKSAENEVSVPVEVGEHMNFGSYQGEEIQWRVLDVKDGNVLLLSEYGLDVQPYHEESVTDIAWADCSLRQWLNAEFYESAFTDEEREKIILSESEGFAEYNGMTTSGKYSKLERGTEDYVFLLSYSEVCHYISDSSDSMSDSEKLCYPTEYVKGNADIDTVQDACDWWLSSASSGSYDRHRPMAVSAYGTINVESGMISNSLQYAVRPAIWIKW